METGILTQWMIEKGRVYGLLGRRFINVELDTNRMQDQQWYVGGTVVTTKGTFALGERLGQVE